MQNHSTAQKNIDPSCPAILYFDNAAASWPKAPGMENCLAEAAAAPPGGGLAALGGARPLELCRSLLAELLCVTDKNRVVLTHGATHALNLALKGFAWREDDLVFTTAAEHNAVLRPLYALKQQGKIKDIVLLPIGMDGRISPELLERKIEQYRPRMLVLTHASHVTGAVNDVPRIAQICRNRHVCVLLDASVTVGVYPVLPEEWGVDMAAGTGAKYLLGPPGTGFLYAAGHVDLKPLYEGDTGAHQDRWTMPEELPSRLEAGTMNAYGLAGLAYCLRWKKQHPMNAKALYANLYALEQGLLSCGAEPLRVMGERVPLLSFTCALPPAQVKEIFLQSYEVFCSAGLHSAPLSLRYLELETCGSVRLSLSRFQERIEVEALLTAMREILD